MFIFSKTASRALQHIKQQQKQQKLQPYCHERGRSLPSVKNLIRLFLHTRQKGIKKGSRDGFPFLFIILVKLEDSHESTLRNLDCTDLTHPLLSLLLLFEELSLT